MTLSYIVFTSMQYTELYLHVVLSTVSPCGTSNGASMRYAELYLNADTNYLSIKDTISNTWISNTGVSKA